jgi:hypothetical protein
MIDIADLSLSNLYIYRRVLRRHYRDIDKRRMETYSDEDAQQLRHCQDRIRQVNHTISQKKQGFPMLPRYEG